MNEEMESYTKPTNYHNFNNFLKNHQSFPYEKGKSEGYKLKGSRREKHYTNPMLVRQRAQNINY